MAELFSKAELSSIIACVDKELGDLMNLYMRHDQTFVTTTLYRHLTTIIKKAKGLANELDKGITKIQTSSLYGEQLNGWMPARLALPKEAGEYIVTVDVLTKPTSFFYDPEEKDWFDVTGNACGVEMRRVDYANVIAWMPMPEAYNAK